MIQKLLLTTCLALLFSMQAMAQIPKVATDTLFARGATMAFGRIKSASFSTRTALKVMSSILPTGVGTTYNFDVFALTASTMDAFYGAKVEIN